MNNTTFNTRFVIGITLVATLGGLLFGYDTAVISGTTQALDHFFVTPLREVYGLTDNMASAIKGFIISSALIGCIFGGMLGGPISQHMGRRNGLILSAFLFSISALGSALPDYFAPFNIPTVASLIFFRIVGGVGVGLASMLSPMYIAEIAPAAIRGKLVSLNQFAIIFGMLVVYFVNYFIALQGDATWLDTIGWRWMFASELIPSLLFFVLLFFVPKTPRFLMLKNETKEAETVLTRLYGAVEAKREMTQIKDTLVEKNMPWLSFGWAVIIIGILISVFQQAVGINVVLYYAPEIFRTIGSGTDASLLQTIIVGIINLTFTVVAILTVDRFGRKPLMIIGAAGMSISMFALAMTFYFEQVGLTTLIFMLIYTASFAVSWGPVAWVLLAEIFPNSIRGALSIAVAVQWLANFLVSWTFPILNENAYLTEHFHHGFSYALYGTMGILTAWFVWKFVPETKGKTLEEIENFWVKPKI